MTLFVRVSALVERNDLMRIEGLDNRGNRVEGNGRRVLAKVYRLRVLGQWFDGIRIYAAASSPTRSRRTCAGLR